MNPEEHLQRTKAPKPGPFLRKTVLDRAGSAWTESSEGRAVRRLAFHPLTAAAALFVTVLLAMIASEIDDRATASLVHGAGYSATTGERDQVRIDSLVDANEKGTFLDDEELGTHAWKGIGSRIYRVLPEESGGDRGS